MNKKEQKKVNECLNSAKNCPICGNKPCFDFTYESGYPSRKYLVCSNSICFLSQNNYKLYANVDHPYRKSEGRELKETLEILSKWDERS